MIVLLVIFCCIQSNYAEQQDLWREDLGRKMNIGVSASGFDEIKLECAEDALDVSIRMEKDFNGVIYVRGNFYARQEPCFLEAHGGRQFHMAIPFHDCKIQTDEDGFKTTLIIQHDSELIMPGDGAFELQCHTQRSDNTGIQLLAVSSISLADPDPSGRDVPTHLKSTVSRTKSVVFRPSDIRPNDARKKNISMKKVEL